MDFHNATDLIKQWLPWATVVGLVWRVYSKAKGSVTEWAGTLLDNHMHHAQASLERIEKQQDKQIEILTRIAEK